MIRNLYEVHYTILGEQNKMFIWTTLPISEALEEYMQNIHGCTDYKLISINNHDNSLYIGES